MRTWGFMPAYGWAVILLIVSSLPGEEVKEVQTYPENQFLMVILSDHFMHFFLFGFLALLIYQGFYRVSQGSASLAKAAFLDRTSGLSENSENSPLALVYRFRPKAVFGNSAG
jgi:hypothetical protein